MPTLATLERLPPIGSLVRRHAEDAAFYWQQIDTSLQAKALGGEGVLHFATLLQAHLDGLEVAGVYGFAPALGALTQARKPGETFAAMYAALISNNVDALAQVMALIARDPSGLLRGAIGAVAAVSEPLAHEWLHGVWQQDESTSPHADASLIAALRACALREWSPPTEVHERALIHPNACVRASAARSLREPNVLQRLLQDADLPVRAEAAIALGRIAYADTRYATLAINTLLQAVSSQSLQCQEATGWFRMQTQRRLDRWLCHLAHLTSPGHPEIATLLPALPLRSALSFVLHHGDPALLPFVLQAMDHAEQARWAGFVWSGLTGIDLSSAGLTQSEPGVDLDAPLTRLQQDADQGLPLPDAEAVQSRDMSDGLSKGQALLLGRPRTTAHLAEVLSISTDTPQVLRAVAAQSWNTQRCSSFMFKIRASASVLLQQDRALMSL